MERQGTPPLKPTRKKSPHQSVSTSLTSSKTNGLSTTPNKKKSLAPIYAPSLRQDEEKKQRRPKTSVRTMEGLGSSKGVSDDASTKRRPKTSTIR